VSEQDTPPPDAPESDWQRRRRLAAVFGDVLPETTRDERDPEPARDGREDPGEAWLRSQVPPHHGGH
jgi:hypothetical protein